MVSGGENGARAEFGDGGEPLGKASHMDSGYGKKSSLLRDTGAPEIPHTVLVPSRIFLQSLTNDMESV